MENFKIEKDDDGILLITFDMPGRSMNVLNKGSMAEIAEFTAMIKSDVSVKGAVITSGKAAFCAGADLEEMGVNAREYVSEVFDRNKIAGGLFDTLQNM